MKQISTYLLIALIAIAGFGCGDNGQMQDGSPMPEMVREAAGWPVGAVPTSEKVIQQTAKGAVHSGEFPLSASQLALIDEGLDALNASMIEDGFRREVLKPHSFYRISTPKQPCILSPESRTPSFVINAGIYYDGTEWDQYNTRGRLPAPQTRNDGATIIYQPDGIGVVFAAELVLNSGNYPGSSQSWMYACPDASILANAVRHGGDHIGAMNLPYTPENRLLPPYDGGVYANCSLFHASGTVHPLFPRAGRCGGESALRPAGEVPRFVVRPVK